MKEAYDDCIKKAKLGQDLSAGVDGITTSQAVEATVNAGFNGFTDVLGGLGLFDSGVRDVVSAYQDASGEKGGFLDAWSNGNTREEVADSLKGDGW